MLRTRGEIEWMNEQLDGLVDRRRFPIAVRICHESKSFWSPLAVHLYATSATAQEFEELTSELNRIECEVAPHEHGRQVAERFDAERARREAPLTRAERADITARERRARQAFERQDNPDARLRRVEGLLERLLKEQSA
jgi:hypothetical protein